MKRFWCAVLVLFFLSGVGLSAEEWTVKLEEAKVYLGQKEYAKAEGILAGLAQKYPNEASVQYYLGLAKLGKKDLDSAKGYLEKAEQLAPRDMRIKMDLAYALIHLKQFDEALGRLSLVITERPDNARALFLRGVVFTNQGQCEKAKTDFSRAKSLSPEYGAEISYYSGICALKQGNKVKAREHFEESAKLGKDTVWEKRSEEFLSKLPSVKRYFAEADIFYQYDSNIVPVPGEEALPEEVSEVADSRAVVWLELGYKPLIKDRAGIGLEYHFYNSWQFEETELNLRIHQGVLNGYYGFKLAGMDARLSGLYMYQYAGVGEDYDYYSTTHRINPRFYLATSDNLITEISYLFKAEEFDEPGLGDFDRDMVSHQIMIGEHILFMNGNLDLAIYGRYQADSAQGKNYDASRYGVRVMAQLAEWKRLSGWAYFDYDYRDFYRTAFDREDEVYSLGLEVDYKVLDYLTVFGGINYSDYKSTLDPYNYDRQIYSLGIKASY